MKGQILSAALIVFSIVVLGFVIKGGIDNFVDKGNKVTVKGLSEREVEADKVIWSILPKGIGSDLPQLYKNIANTQTIIKNFLLSNGILEGEISVNVPSVIDMNANQYSSNESRYRYNITSSIIVTSKKVKLVGGIIVKQGSLLKEEVAIVDGGYENPVRYEYVSFAAMRPKMMGEAIDNAEKTTQQFAENSRSRLNKITSVDQGQFSTEDRDSNTPYIKKVRVVTTATYSLKDQSPLKVAPVG